MSWLGDEFTKTLEGVAAAVNDMDNEMEQALVLRTPPELSDIPLCFQIHTHTHTHTHTNPHQNQSTPFPYSSFVRSPPPIRLIRVVA
jgi:hypothetical protein